MQNSQVFKILIASNLFISLLAIGSFYFSYQASTNAELAYYMAIQSASVASEASSEASACAVSAAQAAGTAPNINQIQTDLKNITLFGVRCN